MLTKASAAATLRTTNSENIIKRFSNINPQYVPYYNENVSSEGQAAIGAAIQALIGLTTNTLTKINLESEIALEV